MPSRSEQVGFVPIPDPTKLTTDAVNAAKSDIEKLFDVKLNGFRDLVQEQFAGRDLAVAAAFKSVQDMTRQQNDSNTLAIDKAALATTKQIDNINTRIDDLKELISEMRSRNWATVGAYIVGALGIAALVAAAVIAAIMK